jgi:Arc/MetJ-type ribon-helix-helix transcriptional regulator
MGRPKTMAARKPVSLPSELAQAVDEYRFANRFKAESDAIRRLIELGLGAAGVKVTKPKAAKRWPTETR